MAGAENRAPDTGEQRAVARALADLHGEPPRHAMENWGNRARVAIEALDTARAADPASVLAHLLAEHPDATITALETLLTSDETVEAAARAMRSAPLPSHMPPDRSRAFVALTAACRALRPNTPNEDR